MTRRLRGAAATVLLLLILAGTPILLTRIGAPLPTTIPGAGQIWDAVRRPDDGTLALAGFTLAAWASWAVMTLSILTELAARARGTRAPVLPGLGWPQHLARRLVGAAALLFLTLPAAAAAAAPLTPAATAAVGAAPAAGPIAATPAAASTASATTPTTTPAARSVPPRTSPPPGPPSPTGTVEAGDRAGLDQDLVEYRIRPGDTLWDIAERHLGDGMHYPRLVDLNQDTIGDDPGFLTPGTLLRLPATYHVQPGDTLTGIADRELGDPAAYRQIAAENDLADPDVIDVGEVLTLPGGTAPQPITPGEGQHHDQAQPPTPPPGEAPPAAPAPPRAPADVAPAPEVSLSRPPAPPAAPASPAPVAPTPATADAAPAAEVGEGISGRTLIGLTGGGGLLAASLLTLLELRRRRQFRARRPGRTITTPDPALAPVETTLLHIGAAARPTAAALDTALRHLGHTCTTTGTPLPDIAAVALHRHGTITLHLAGDTPPDAPAPWTGDPNARTWTLTTAPGNETDPGGDVVDLPAPWPLLATIGTSDEETTWLLNLEGLTVLIAGDPVYGADWIRYLVADLGCSPWAAEVRITILGGAAGTELADLDPTRITLDPDPGTGTAAVAAAARKSVDRLTDHDQPDTRTARAALAGDDAWPAQMVVLAGAPPALTAHLDAHPGTAATGILCDITGTPDPATAATGPAAGPSATTVTLTPHGRVIVNGAGLDLVAVGLTGDEATGIAALLKTATDLRDTPVPDLDETHPDAAPGGGGWRAFADAAGALRPEHTDPRHPTPTPEPVAETGVQQLLLPEPDQDYLDVAATTTDDLARLAPAVPPTVSAAVQDADPTLDADLADWRDPTSTRPRLTLLGPVAARAAGPTPENRLAYYTEVLAYLMLRPTGATADDVAAAFDLTTKRTHTVIGVLRSWVGDHHLPDARHSPAARHRGIGVYQIVDGLTDLDLFRRLRLRGQARGTTGIPDLLNALTLVTGPPFTHLRPSGWTWLHEGDRHDEHATVAIVDTAHIIVLDALTRDDPQIARAAAETAHHAAPYEDIPTLDLAAITRAEGDLAAAQLLLDTLTTSTTDGIPDDPPPRTNTVLQGRAHLT